MSRIARRITASTSIKDLQNKLKQREEARERQKLKHKQEYDKAQLANPTPAVQDLREEPEHYHE